MTVAPERAADVWTNVRGCIRAIHEFIDAHIKPALIGSFPILARDWDAKRRLYLKEH